MPNRTLVSIAVFCISLVTPAAHAQDPPSRIARLNYATGNVSMQPAGIEDWTQAEVNRPFTTGDNIYTDAAARAEFHLDTAVLRAGEYTTFGFFSLTDQATQIRLSQGDLYVNVHELAPTQTFEVDSPNSAVALLRPGVYRFRVTSNGQLTFVVVRQGEAEITGGPQAVSVVPGSSASISGTDQLAYESAAAPPADEFDNWSQDRDAAETRSESAGYLPRNVVGYEDMNTYGDWQPAPEYGQVWYPRMVVAGWAPYHNGHWAWIEPWGWTWVDDAPWGFAPFHYGRWVFISGRWGWTPGPIIVVNHRPPVMRPVYAPALVAWFGGPRFGISIAIGGGAPHLGWVPLGFGEVYTPSYHCSQHYFSNVNVSNTTVVRNVNITNVYNTVYVNKTVYNQTYVNMHAPNAVTAMPQSAFASGRPVAQAAVRIEPRQMANFRAQDSGVVAPQVAPSRQALIGNRSGGPVARPSAQVAARQVMVRNAPATAPAPFAVRQAYLQQHAGEPHDFATMHQQVAPAQTPQQTRFVRPAPQPVAVTPAQPQVARPERDFAKPAATPAPRAMEGQRPAQPPAVRPEAPRTELPRPEQPKLEHSRPEQARPEQARPEAARSYPAREHVEHAQPKPEAKPAPKKDEPKKEPHQ